MPTPQDSLPIERRLLTLRGQRVILDTDLAALYGVAVKRNANRFPLDFAFQLTREEVREMRAQNVTSNSHSADEEEDSNVRSQIVTLLPEDAKSTGVAEVDRSVRDRGHFRYQPWVYTEFGAIQASNVLNSPLAIRMGVAVVRAFVRLRQVIADHKTLAAKLDELDARISEHDHQLTDLVAALRALLAHPEPNHGRKIGFQDGNR